MRAPGPYRGIRCVYLLRLYSDVVTVRHSGAGSYRRVNILVVFDDMFRVYTCTRTVFEQVCSRLLASKPPTRYHNLELASPASRNLIPLKPFIMTLRLSPGGMGDG